VATRYDEALSGLPLLLPAHPPEGDTHAWHLYVTRLSDDASLDRDVFISEMAKFWRGLQRPLHPAPYAPILAHPVPAGQPASSLVATAEFRRVVSLPIFSSMTDSQVEQVIETVRKILW